MIFKDLPTFSVNFTHCTITEVEYSLSVHQAATSSESFVLSVHLIKSYILLTLHALSLFYLPSFKYMKENNTNI